MGAHVMTSDAGTDPAREPLGEERDRTRQALTSVPVIDLSPFLSESDPAARRAVASAIREACIDIGFFYIDGHGFSPEELDRVLREGMSFFELPVQEKTKLGRSGPAAPGYYRSGVDSKGGPDVVPDLKERFFMGNDASASDQSTPRAFSAAGTPWPPVNLVPNFESTMKDYMTRQTVLVKGLARAFAASLELPEDYFDFAFDGADLSLALNMYPPVDPKTVRADQWSFAPHSDYGAFTILLQDSSGGLQARNASDQWIDVPPRRGTFVVNIADLFARWTNDLYVSTLHRGRHAGTGPRLSVALFVSPSGSTIVQCLGTCQGPGNPPRYAPVEAAEYVQMLMASAYRNGRPGIATDTAERLKKDEA